MHRFQIIATGMCLFLLLGCDNGQLKRIERLEQEVSKMNDQLGKLRRELHPVIAAYAGATTTVSADVPLPGAEGSDLKTAANVEEAILKLSEAATAQDLATCLTEVDSWVIVMEDEQKAVRSKEQLASRLRQQVKKEVTEIQRVCLSEPTGNKAIMRHAEAGQILALYPMSDKQDVIDEAKALSARQVDIATRIDVLRRQRYNRWATMQIEAAIDGYNQNSSIWSPKKENKVLMDSLVQSLAKVDPGLLEPAIMELYHYIIDRTKNSISESEKIQLAKRLTDPSTPRKTLGDF